MREVETRYDFKGIKSTVEVVDGGIKIFADDDLKRTQMYELIQIISATAGLSEG